MKTKTNQFSKWSKYRPKKWYEKYWVEIVIFFIGLCLINIFLFAKTFKGDFIESTKAGQYGDFIGGYIGTIFVLISVLLLYITLKNQRILFEQEKFEERFFELLKLHRENVNELSIAEKEGKKVFVILVREFREILNIVKEQVGLTKLDYNKEKIINLAYLIFFYGLGPNSTRVLKSSLTGYDDSLIDVIIKKLSKIQKKLKNGHILFDGNQSRLGHYYRHLYQTITFIHYKNIQIDKYEYIKTLRSQLTNHEQALLFFNSLSKLGKTWREENLIEEYRLIKNLPKNFIDPHTEINVKDVYPNLVFEYEENEK